MPTLVRMAAGLGVISRYAPSGTITTGTIDFGVTPGGVVSFSVESTGSTVALTASRSSVDGIAWSAWEAPNEDNELTSPIRQYYDLLLTLATTDSQATPTLTSVSLIADGTVPANWKWGYGGQWQ